MNSSKRRRAHHKVRTGCLGCRARRVKCTEEKPTCQSCARRETSCEYPVLSVNGAKKDTPLLQSSPRHGSAPPLNRRTYIASPASSASPAALSSLTAHEGFDLNDLALMHHWTLHIAVASCRAPEQANMWQQVFPEIGFDYPFVNSAILSIAALHLSHLCEEANRREAHVTRATQHHDAGLRASKSFIANITSVNFEAVFVWSILNIIYVFGMWHHDPAGKSSRKDLALGAEWIPMMKGIGAIVASVPTGMSSGRMDSLTSVGNFYVLDPGPFTTTGEDGALCKIRKIWENDNDAVIYDECLLYMRRSRMFSAQFDRMDAAALAEWKYYRGWAAPFICIFAFPEKFFTLLSQRQPSALAIFAFYGAEMHRAKEFWFIGSLGKEIVKAVDDILGPYWQSYLSWPLEFVSSAD